MKSADNSRWLQLLAAVACFLLGACIDGREEIWIRADGSGRAKINYQIPAAALALHGGADGVSEIIGEFLANNGALFSESSHQIREHGKRVELEIEVSFHSLPEIENMELSSDKLPPPVRHFAGEFELRQSGRTVSFSRTISPAKGIPGIIFVPRSQFKNRRLVYIMHLPAPVTSSNATRVENGGRTLVWDQPLAGALRQPLVTRFEAQIPIPKWMIAGAVVIALVVLWLAIRGIRAILAKRVAVS